IRAPHLAKAERTAVEKFPQDIQAIWNMPAEERSPLEIQLADLIHRQVVEEQEKIKPKGEDEERLKELEKQLAEFDHLKPKPLPSAQTVSDVGPTAPVVLVPGQRNAEPIAPGFLTVLEPGPADVDAPADSTGRRTALARWIASPDNPLSTRVIVNRVWQHHFGRGIVATPSDFGRLGEEPSHPDLLDWLTSRFLENGWRLKPLHRLIMTSATYRQSAESSGNAEFGVRNAELKNIPHSEHSALRTPNSTLSSPTPHSAFRTPHSLDPDNRLLGRWVVRRLDAEQIRDAVLSVTGELDPKTGGPSVDHSVPRRTVYAKVIRNDHDPLLEAFDAPGRITSRSDRNVTTSSTQALLMINGPWLLARAKALAARLGRSGETDADRITLAFRLCYGRVPTPQELLTAEAFLSGQSARIGPADRTEALTDFCHVLLNSNEFLYVD
ncbi:MAG: DUF1553 domain-containing protein, partial [Planctomycetaceae bacterium]